MKPLAIDLFCGLGGWSEALLAEGYDVVGFDIERHRYPARVMPDASERKVGLDGVDFNNPRGSGSEKRSFNHANEVALREAPLTGGWMEYSGQLVIQDVLTLRGSQFRDAALIVASPPCQEFSYMAMPWSRAKEKARQYRSGELDVADLTRLFWACFRIQREACEAAGRHIPMIVENVRGAQPWVGRARWNFGSFYLWGDVPALMPPTNDRKMKGGDWGRGNSSPAARPDLFFQGDNCSEQRRHQSNSPARKGASAMIAKIPAPLAAHIARTFLPPRTSGVVADCRRRHGGACHTIYAADMETVVRTQDCVDWCPLLRRKINA